MHSCPFILTSRADTMIKWHPREIYKARTSGTQLPPMYKYLPTVCILLEEWVSVTLGMYGVCTIGKRNQHLAMLDLFLLKVSEHLCRLSIHIAVTVSDKPRQRGWELSHPWLLRLPGEWEVRTRKVTPDLLGFNKTYKTGSDTCSFSVRVQTEQNIDLQPIARWGTHLEYLLSKHHFRFWLFYMPYMLLTETSL